MLDWSLPCFFLSIPFDKLKLNWEEFLAICPKKGYLVLQGEGLLNGSCKSGFLKRLMLGRPAWTLCAFQPSEGPTMRLTLHPSLRKISASELFQMLQKAPHGVQFIKGKV